MTPLQWDIQKLLRVNRDGSHTTQYQRKMMAFRYAKDMHGMGYRDLRLRGIGNRHVDKAVNRWKQQGWSHATIMNRLSMIRWLGPKDQQAESWVRQQPGIRSEWPIATSV